MTTTSEPRVEPRSIPHPAIEVTSPATGERLGAVPLMDEEATQEALARARAAQQVWGRRPVAARAALVRRFAQLLAARSDEVARLLVRENGKTIQEAYAMEVLPVTYLATYFADNAERILAPQPIPMRLLLHKWSAIEHRPRGVALVISPWNFPLSIPLGEALMALIAGNAVLHKPASLTPLIALKAQALLREAGLPEHLYQVLPCAGRTAFDLIGPGVDYVSFTGSTEVGRLVSERCGRNLIPCTTELGGKDPTILLDDADLDRAAGAIVWGAFANSGQACASVERVYVPRALHTDLLARVLERTEALRQGDPESPETDIGAMTDLRQLEVVDAQVESARRAGAEVLAGGGRLDGPGRFYRPTVLTGVTDAMEVAREETFGPVLPILSYRTIDEVIERANGSPFGLTASVFGRDEQRARRVAARLQAGTVMLNEVLYTHALAETPWSGVKASGTGRVHSDEGLRDLCLRVHVHGNRLPAPRWEPTWYPYSKLMLRVLQTGTRVLAEHGVGARLRRLATELLRG